MRRSAAVAVALLGACGEGESLEYTGVAGRPVPASFDQWVPGVTAQVAGEPAHLLIDTGAPLTLLDRDAFALADGEHQLDVAVGDLAFPELPVVAYDLITYAQTREPPLDGILGGDVLTSFALSLDYQDARIWLEDEPGGLPEGVDTDAVGAAVGLPAVVAGGGAFPVPGGGHRAVGATRFLLRAEAEEQGAADGFWVLVDTGASSVVLASDVLADLGDLGRPRLEGVTVGTAAGVETAYLTRVWSLRLREASGGPSAVDLASVPVLVLDGEGLFDAVSGEVGEEVRGIVGGTYLRWFLTTIDYPDEMLRLYPYGAPDHIDPDEYVGLGFTLEAVGEAWVIGTVYPGTDAAGEGLQEGEVVTSLDGTALAGLVASEVEGLVADRTVGEEVAVGLLRAEEVIEVLVSVEDLLPPFEAPG